MALSNASAIPCPNSRMREIVSGFASSRLSIVAARSMTGRKPSPRAILASSAASDRRLSDRA
jgi:hypothetical protein